MQAGQEARPARIDALDGLRGAAALGVVITHALLSSVPYAGWYGHDWLYPLWLGPEAVKIFFVLSGLVLTLPVALGRELQPASYYVSRFIRLYFPVWGALVVAAILHRAAGWEGVPGASWWLNAHAYPMTVDEGARNASLFGAGGFQYFSAVWTLKWEVIVSVLLPLFVWVAAKFRRWPITCAVVGLAVTATEASEYATYVPVFFLGCILAFHVTALRSWWVTAPALRGAYIGGGIVLLTADWWHGPPTGAPGVTSPLIAAGAATVVTLAVVSPRFASLFPGSAFGGSESAPSACISCTSRCW
jgi:peptidoglycan/LPS O-acetylase OafA/YrhL